jgi:hypothetical protein
MKIVSAIALFPILLAVGSRIAAAAAVNHLPDDVRAALKEPGAFQLRAALSGIPDSVRAAFIKLTPEDSFSMAEPGARYQSTDVPLPGPPLVPGPPPSFRRLVNVALSKSFCILFYERGGIAWSAQIAVFGLTKEGAKLVWSGYSNRIIADPAHLLTAVDQDEIHGAVKYF